MFLIDEFKYQDNIHLLHERVQPVGLTSLSYKLVILHVDMDQIKVHIQIHPAGIGLNNKYFLSTKYKKKPFFNLKTAI